MVSEWLKSNDIMFEILHKPIGTNKKPWIQWSHDHLAVNIVLKNT